jgi:hypothetical protein
VPDGRLVGLGIRWGKHRGQIALADGVVDHVAGRRGGRDGDAVMGRLRRWRAKVQLSSWLAVLIQQGEVGVG